MAAGEYLMACAELSEFVAYKKCIKFFVFEALCIHEVTMRNVTQRALMKKILVAIRDKET